MYDCSIRVTALLKYFEWTQVNTAGQRAIFNANQLFRLNHYGACPLQLIIMIGIDKWAWSLCFYV